MHKKKTFSLILVVALLFGMINFSGMNSYAEPGTNIKLTLSPATEGRYDYYTYEEAVVYLDLDLSGFESNIQDSDLVITVPKEYLNAMVGSTIGSATGPTAVTTADGQYQLTYHFSKLTGGTSLRIPIRVQTLPGTTPENYVLPINATLVASDETDLAIAEELDLKQKTRDPIITKYKSTPGGVISYDGSTTYGGQGTATDSNIIKPGTENPQVFYFNVAYEAAAGTAATTYLGVRKYEKIIIRDTLTDGAVFVQSLNPGWVYDADTNTASYTMNNPSLHSGATTPVGFNAPSLSLIYPNGDVRNTFNNTASVEFVPQNKQIYENDNVVSTDGIKFKMTTILPGTMTLYKGSSNFADQITQKEANKVWTCSATNQSDSFGLENLVLEDSGLDARLEYTSIRLMSTFNNLFSGTVDIEGEDATGTVTTIAQNVSGGNTEYAIPSGTIKVYIKSTDGSYLLPGKTFSFYVTTKLKDPENVHYDAVNNTNNRFLNTLKSTGEYVGTDVTSTGTRLASIYIVPYAPSVYLTKRSSKTSLFVGETTTFTLDARSYNTMMAPDTINDSSVIDLLPQGLEYVAGSASIAYNLNFVSKEPTVVQNYKGTGQTALIWTSSKDFEPAGIYFYISYQAKATKTMSQGVNTNKAYWIWSNNGFGSSEIQPVTVGYTTAFRSADLYDFDNDGNVTEYVAYSAVNVTYTPPREVIASKYTKGSLDLEDTLIGGRTEIGADFSYTLKVWNNSIVDLNRLSAVEVLPYVGDKTIVADGEENYLSRNSEFKVDLTGPVIGPTGYTVYYSTQVPASDSVTSPADYCARSDWMPEAMVSDWSTIRGIKIVMNAGTTLRVGETAKFDVPVKSLSDMSLANGEAAHNSFAISLNGEKEFLEANSTSVTLTSYKVSGTLFNDANKNGLLDDGEEVFKNQEVQLFEEDGTPAVDLDGNLIKTTTKEDGTYQFAVYNKGTYYVHVTAPDYYIATEKGSDDNPLASHVSVTTGNTDTFELTADANSAVRNAGYYANTGDLTIKKVLLDSDGNIIDETREFTILVTGPSYPDGKEMTLSNETPLLLEHLEYGTYEVKELDASIYEVSISGTVTLSYENRTGEITVQNKEKTVESASLDIEKIIGERTTNGGSNNGGTNNGGGNSNYVIGIHGAATIAIGKTAELMPNVDETFTFELIPGEDTFPMPHDSEVTIEGEGTASFGTWNYTKPGTYTYQVKEVAGEDSHYTYDGTVYTITDTVALNDAGDLEVSRVVKNSRGAIVTGALSFANQFTAKPVTAATVQIEKIIGEKTSHDPTTTRSHNGGGNSDYVIGIHGAATLAIGKATELMPNIDEAFTFELIPDENTFPMPHDSKVTIEGEGTASFGTWSYTEPGEYTYQVKEVTGDNSHYTYDKTLYTIIDTVTLNDAGDLEVTRIVQNDREETVDGALAFTNQFTAKPVAAATLDVEKTVKGNPNVDETFTFELAPDEETFPMPGKNGGIAEVTIGGSGTASFGTWSYTEPGEYTYQVKEVAGDNSHYTYDKTLYTIIDTVTLNDAGDLEVTRVIQNDSGETINGALAFTNEYTNSKTNHVTKPNNPNDNLAVQTGDNSHPYVLLAVAIGSLILLLILGLIWRRKK